MNFTQGDFFDSGSSSFSSSAIGSITSSTDFYSSSISFCVLTVLSLVLQDLKFEVGEKRDTINTEIDSA